MDRRGFLGKLLTTGVLLKIRRLVGARETALSGEELSRLLAKRLSRSPWSYVAPNRPLTAIYHSHHQAVLPDGRRNTWAQRGNLVRDTEGRVRLEEYHIDPESGEVVEQSLTAVIVDPILGETYALLFKDRLATKRRYGPATHGHSDATPKVDNINRARLYEDVQATPLGTRMLEGFECHGQIIKASIHTETQRDLPTQVSVEDWVAPRLGTPLLTKVSISQGTGGGLRISTEHLLKLTNIIEGEPAPELFRIPSEFRIEEFKGQTQEVPEVSLEEIMRRP